MIHFLKALIRAGLKRRGTILVLAYLCLLLASSFLIMFAEPETSDLNGFGNALWWSIVTSTTVGYGDLYPGTPAGKIIAVLLPMFMGIGLGAAFITHVASYLIERRDKRMHGDAPFTGSDHILIVGYTSETEYLIQEIQMDETYAHREIVLLADQDRHPCPELDTLCFVRGRPDTLDALNRANTSRARWIVIHTGSDEESLFALVNTMKLKQPDCEVTVRCLSTQSLDTFSSVAGDFQIIMQMTAEMMVQAMQDKVHLPLQILLRNNADAEIYYVTVADIARGTGWWDLHLYLMDRYGYLSFAIQLPDDTILVNPDKQTPVGPGCGIWLMATNRPMRIDWPL